MDRGSERLSLWGALPLLSLILHLTVTVELEGIKSISIRRFLIGDAVLSYSSKNTAGNQHESPDSQENHVEGFFY